MFSTYIEILEGDLSHQYFTKTIYIFTKFFEEWFRSSTSGPDWSITTSLPWAAADIEEAVQLFLIPHDLYRLKRTKKKGEEKKGKKKKKEDLACLCVCVLL